MSQSEPRSRPDLSILLLRHGESVTNVAGIFASRADPALAPSGVTQARLQAEAIAAGRVVALYASPLLRARQTAAMVAERTGLTPTYLEDLIEIDVGEMEGASTRDEAALAVYHSVLDHWERGEREVRFPGGESLGEVLTRLHRVLDPLFAGQLPQGTVAEVRAQKALPYGRVVLVGHSLLYAVAIWFFVERPGRHLINAHMKRGCLSILHSCGGSTRLEAFNITPENARAALHAL